MDLEFLPQKILTHINLLDFDLITEIRIRTNYGVLIQYNGEYKFLSKNGLTNSSKSAIICYSNDIDNIINYITENSFYAFNDQIKQGFLTTKNGIRIGIAGDCVFENNKIITIKNIFSLNIRIPHKVKGCANKILEHITRNGINNSLIISPPGCGKTTILKDLAFSLNDRFSYQILLIDERGEFSNVNGENIDKISYSNKYFAFVNGIRALSPQIIMVDELIGRGDWQCVKDAINCGVKIIATIHGENIEDIFAKKYFCPQIFDKYFLVCKEDTPGILKEVYNKNLCQILN